MSNIIRMDVVNKKNFVESLNDGSISKIVSYAGKRHYSFFIFDGEGNYSSSLNTRNDISSLIKKLLSSVYSIRSDRFVVCIYGDVVMETDEEGKKQNQPYYDDGVVYMYSGRCFNTILRKSTKHSQTVFDIYMEDRARFYSDVVNSKTTSCSSIVSFTKEIGKFDIFRNFLPMKYKSYYWGSVIGTIGCGEDVEMYSYYSVSFDPKRNEYILSDFSGRTDVPVSPCGGQSIKLKNDEPISILVLYSGGVDSFLSTCYVIDSIGAERIEKVVLLYFKYNSIAQEVERSYVEIAAEYFRNRFGVPIVCMEKDLDLCLFQKSKIHNYNYSDVMCSSSKKSETGDLYVPMRNFIFTSVAAAIAEDSGCSVIVVGSNTSDSFNFKESSSCFVEKMNSLLKISGKIDSDIRYISPFVNTSKTDLIRIGLDRKYDYESNTISCFYPKFKDGKVSVCGVCYSCVVRNVAEERCKLYY